MIRYFILFIFAIGLLIGGPFVFGPEGQNVVRAQTAASNLNDLDSFTISLAKGWNQISISNLSAFLSFIFPFVHSVYFYLLSSPLFSLFFYL